MMRRGRSRPLTRRYTLGVAAIAMLLMLLAGGLAATQFAAERTARLELIARTELLRQQLTTQLPADNAKLAV